MSTRAAGRSGRRPGAPDTRGAILDAARAAFATRGYAASLRDVARAAGVDPSLVLHYFGSKRGLFVAAVELPLDPAARLALELEQGRDAIGLRVAMAFLGVWDDPEASARMIGLLRAAVSEPEFAAMLRVFVIDEGLASVLAKAGLDEAPRRATLCATQLLGVALVRYLLGFEPVATMERAELARLIAPTLARYLVEPLAESGTP